MNREEVINLYNKRSVDLIVSYYKEKTNKTNVNEFIMFLQSLPSQILSTMFRTSVDYYFEKFNVIELFTSDKQLIKVY